MSDAPREALALEKGDIMLLWGMVDNYFVGERRTWVRLARIHADLTAMMDRIDDE